MFKVKSILHGEHGQVCVFLEPLTSSVNASLIHEGDTVVFDSQPAQEVAEGQANSH